MTLWAAVAELLARIGANGGAPVFIGAPELAEWPAASVTAIKAQKLLLPARPAASVVCPGCECACVMPVHLISAQARAARAFVVCDKRDDINRVSVSIAHLEQWQASGETVADWIARGLGLMRTKGAVGDTGRWEVGMLRGAKHASHLVLLAEGEQKLSLAGHTVVLADALDINGDSVFVDRRTLNRCLDNPVAGTGDARSREQRIERLRKRRNELKAQGVRNYNEVLAKEEGCSKSANTWLRGLPVPKGDVPRKPKARD